MYHGIKFKENLLKFYIWNTAMNDIEILETREI